MARRLPLLVLTIALCVLPGISADAKAIQIVMDKLVYVPVETVATVGDATATNGDWNVVITAKKTERLVLTKPGQVDYFCKYHPNMKGRITIAP